MSIIDNPKELRRYIRHVVYLKYDGEHREDSLSAAMLRVLEILPRIDRNRSEAEIRQFCVNAALHGARRSIDERRSVLSTHHAVENMSQYSDRTKALVDFALTGRRHQVRNHEGICIDILNIVAAPPSPIVVRESEPLIEAIPEDSRARLIKRYDGASVEDVAAQTGLSRVQVRMREVADMRRAGAL